MKAINSYQIDSDNEASSLFQEVQSLALMLEKVAEEHAAEVGLTAARWKVLCSVQGSHMAVPAIARRLGLARQSVQHTTDRLVEGRFARYVDNPDHIRSRLVSLTQKGSEALRTLAVLQSDWLAHISENMEAVNIRIAAGVLRGIAGNIRG